MELAGQRSAAAARLNDPLWYRIEEFVSSEETPMAPAANKLLPEQVQIVDNALAHNHMSRADVTPQAFCVLLEQARRYALELLADAQDYASCANRPEVTAADLELANQMRPDVPIAVNTQIPKLGLWAQHINRIPLPPIPPQCYSGVLLPPKRHQLTARTYDVVSGAQVAQRMVQPKPQLAKKASSKSSAIPKPSYGANRGRQIPIQLKEKEPSEKAAEAAPSGAPTETGATSAAAAPASGAPAPGSTSSADAGGPAPMEISSPAATAPAPASTGPAPATAPSAAAASAPPAPAAAPTGDAPPAKQS